MKFSDSINREAIIPYCTLCCLQDRVILVDVVLTTKEDRHGTLPIWQCDRCGIVFGERKYPMTHIISRHIPSGGLILDKTEDLNTKIKHLSKALNEQKQDLLSTIRKRVNKFTLS